VTEPLKPDEVNDILFARVEWGGESIGHATDLDVALSLPITDPRHIPIKTGIIHYPPIPEQVSAVASLIAFYDTPWWRRVWNGLFKR
jgi:hypothetical protein